MDREDDPWCGGKAKVAKANIDTTICAPKVKPEVSGKELSKSASQH
jgi:hypothetical protein